MNPHWGCLNGLLPLVYPTRDFNVDESGFGDDDDDDGNEPSGAENLTYWCIRMVLGMKVMID